MADQMRPAGLLSYSIDKTDFIRQALSGYAGGIAIASEMVQNADDAEASHISFHFRPDALVVRNDSVFTEKDFDRITNIARGDKRTEEGKIGTWGTGFLSVFHLTDAPELLSAGRHITFDPTQNQLPWYETSVTDRTEFRLPWRRRQTELGRALESDTWDHTAIQRLQDDMATAIYRLVIFLRHVRVIEVFGGDDDERLLYRIERRRIEATDRGDFVRELWELEYQRTGVQTRTDTWLYYCGQVPRYLAVEGVTVKDFYVALAFPL